MLIYLTKLTHTCTLFWQRFLVYWTEKLLTHNYYSIRSHGSCLLDKNLQNFKICFQKHYFQLESLMDGMRVALILVITLPGGTCSARCIILRSCLLLWLWFLGFALTRLTENIPKKENHQSFEIMIFSQSLTQLNICKHLPTSQVSVCMSANRVYLTWRPGWWRCQKQWRVLRRSRTE